MRILQSNGNVGIGTIAPRRKLHVVDTTSLMNDTVWLTGSTFRIEDSIASAGYFVAANRDADANIGLLGRSYNGTNYNIGVVGASLTIVPISNDTMTNFGVTGVALGSTDWRKTFVFLRDASCLQTIALRCKSKVLRQHFQSQVIACGGTLETTWRLIRGSSR